MTMDKLMEMQVLLTRKERERQGRIMGFFDDEADEELEDELEERTGYSMFELERMSRAERNRVIEKAGLDPDDYDGLF